MNIALMVRPKNVSYTGGDDTDVVKDFRYTWNHGEQWKIHNKQSTRWFTSSC